MGKQPEATPVWKDASSWSRSDDEETRKTPTSWEVEFCSILIRVHHYVSCGDTWFVTCYQLDIVKAGLDTEDAETAKLEAVNMVMDKTDALHMAAKEIYAELGG